MRPSMASARFASIVLALVACLIAGCSGQATVQPVDSTDSSFDVSVEHESPSVHSSESRPSEAPSATSEHQVDLGTDEHIDAIAKSWRTFAVLYGGEVYPFSNYPTFEDLYDNTYITIYDNGRFAYQSSAIYTYRGTWMFYDDYDGVFTFVLRTDSVAKVTPESGLGGEEIGSGDGKVFIVYVFGDRPFLVVTEKGDDLNETPTPAFIETDEWRVPMEPSISNRGTADGSVQTDVTDSSSGQRDSKTSTPATPAPSAPSHTATAGERRALEQAKAYLDVMAFSREGLIEQLEYEGFSHSEAVYGADHTGADWNEQAVRKAREYLEIFPMSYDELVDQLEFEGFTHSEAVYGASNA